MRCNVPEILPSSEFTEAWQKCREQIIHLLCKEEYGFLPPAPVKLSWETTETQEDFCAGKAPLRKVLLHATLDNDNLFTFPISVVIPVSDKKLPFFVHISFSPLVPDKYMPSEEIADNGFGMLSFYYEDVTADNGNFTNGIAGALGYNDNSISGKIMLWAWAAMRVMDFAVTLPELDTSCSAVVGHSRLGKTALLAGALDTRFEYVISNNSGCCGAAISREKQGERIQNITDMFPYWFRAGFEKYAGNEASMPFDQHFLLAASAPRHVYVASAADDSWADPESEFLGCVLAGEVWAKLKFAGFICDDNTPMIGKPYHSGRVAYHVRDGVHYLGREDWQRFMQFISGHQGTKE
jgi:hypothetical protein